MGVQMERMNLGWRNSPAVVVVGCLFFPAVDTVEQGKLNATSAVIQKIPSQELELQFMEEQEMSAV